MRAQLKRGPTAGEREELLAVIEKNWPLCLRLFEEYHQLRANSCMTANDRGERPWALCGAESARQDYGNEQTAKLKIIRESGASAAPPLRSEKSGRNGNAPAPLEDPRGR